MPSSHCGLTVTASSRFKSFGDYRITLQATTSFELTRRLLHVTMLAGIPIDAPSFQAEGSNFGNKATNTTSGFLPRQFDEE